MSFLLSYIASLEFKINRRSEKVLSVDAVAFEKGLLYTAIVFH